MSRGHLTASQLDRIEDALEGLEDFGVDDALLSSSDEDSRIVAEHLDAYRQILVLTRDALPLEDAPVGALDGVIAQAHASVGAAGVDDVEPVAAAKGEDGKSWWQRLHAAVWVPALGFAGAAAMLLLVLQPGGQEEAPVVAQSDVGDAPGRRASEAGAAAPDDKDAKPEAPATEAIEDGRLADAVTTRDEAEENLRGAGLERRPRVRERGDAVDPFAAGDEAGPGQAEDADVDPARGIALGGADAPPPAVTPKPAPNAAPKKKTKTSSKPSGGVFPGSTKTPSAPPPPADPAPEPEPTPDVGGKLDDEEKQNDAGKDVGGDAKKGAKNDNKQSGKKKEQPAVDYLHVLQRGEKARKLGKCGSAKGDFNEAKLSPDAKIRARALAGLGLCALSAGNDATAESMFSKARKADPSIDSFISRERKAIEGSAPAAQKQSKE